jgi:hypothetical protein
MDWEKLQNPSPDSISISISISIQITWLGHSGLLVQMNGCSIVNFTDPIFSQRCSPFQWIGPKRFRPPMRRVPVDGIQELCENVPQQLRSPRLYTIPP